MGLVEGFGVGGAELGGKFDTGGDVFLFAEMADVFLDFGEGHGEVAGDAAVGPAVENSAQDGLAAEGLAAEAAGAGEFAGGLVPGGFGDFVAEKQAAGEGGDDEVPALAGGAGGPLDFVAFCAGEGGCWRKHGLGVVPQIFAGSRAETALADSGVEAEEIEEGVGRERTIDGSDGFFAGGAEPAVADEAGFVFVAMVFWRNGQDARGTR